MEISIIIPVYNKEDFVEKSIRSALNQDFDDFEVIAVDDESTDQSGAICDRLAQEDSRLRVFHISNRRVTGARLYGVEQARGNYIMFLDSDDELLPNALKATYPVIIKEDADEVFATYRDQYGHHYTSHEGWIKDTDGLIIETCNRTARFSFAWGILYKKEILKDCLNPEMGHMYSEDKLMQMKVLMKRPKVFFIRDCIYLYNIGIPNSWKSYSLAKDIELEEELKKTFAPHWDRLQTAYIMHRIKVYEDHLSLRDFEGCKHFQDLRHVKDKQLSRASKIILSLPPRLAWIPVWLYRKHKR